MLNGKEARRPDMIWAIINRNYRRMTIKTVAFPVHHVGRSSGYPTLNADKVNAEIIGSALYAGLTDFLNENPEHGLNFTAMEKERIYQNSMSYMSRRMLSLKQGLYRINGLAKVLANSRFSDELATLTNCIEAEFSITAYDDIKGTIEDLSLNDLFHFLDRIAKSTDVYDDAKKIKSAELVGDEILDGINKITN